MSKNDNATEADMARRLAEIEQREADVAKRHADQEQRQASLDDREAELDLIAEELNMAPKQGDKLARGEERPAYQKLDFDGPVDVVASGFRNQRIEHKGGKACCKEGYALDDAGYVVPAPAEADEE